MVSPRRRLRPTRHRLPLPSASPAPALWPYSRAALPRVGLPRDTAQGPQGGVASLLSCIGGGRPLPPPGPRAPGPASGAPAVASGGPVIARSAPVLSRAGGHVGRPPRAVQGWVGGQPSTQPPCPRAGRPRTTLRLRSTRSSSDGTGDLSGRHRGRRCRSSSSRSREGGWECDWQPPLPPPLPVPRDARPAAHHPHHLNA